VTLVRAFDLLGKRWTGVLLGTLRDGPVGSAALSRAIPGISDSVLSSRLTELADAGLGRPLRRRGPAVAVSYALTEAGSADARAGQISGWPTVPSGPAVVTVAGFSGPRQASQIAL